MNKKRKVLNFKHDFELTYQFNSDCIKVKSVGNNIKIMNKTKEHIGLKYNEPSEDKKPNNCLSQDRIFESWAW